LIESWGEVVVSLVEALEAKERAAAEQVAALREQLAALTGQVVVAEALVARYREARETVCEVLTEAPNAPAWPNQAVTAPLLEAATGGAVPDYEGIVFVLEQAGGPLTCRQMLEAVGCATEPRFVEGVRAKAKRLVERGQVLEVARGSFALAGGGK